MLPESSEIKCAPQTDQPNPATDQQDRCDLSKPNFLHPVSILFEVGTLIRRFLIPTVLAVYSMASGGVLGVGVAILIFGGVLATTLVRHFTMRYRISGNDFIVTQGLLFRRVRSVPIRRIQNVDLVQNIFHRMLGVAEVRLETASGKESEATLRVLTNRQIEELRHAIFDTRVHDARVQASSLASASAPEAAAEPQLALIGARQPAAETQPSQQLNAISPKHLVLAGLASNRGAVLIGIGIGLLFQQGAPWNPVGDQREWFRGSIRFNLEQITRLWPDFDSRFGYALAAVLGLGLLLLCLRVFGIAWYFLRFYDHKLSLHGDDLHISCGLLTKVSATIPRKRIQFISVNRSLLMRWMKLASIRIETAGGAGKEGEDAAATVSRRWFLPVVPESQVNHLLRELRPGLNWDESLIQWQTVSSLTFRRLLRASLIAALILCLVGWFSIKLWGLALGLTSLPIFVWLAYKKSRSMRYARTTWGIAYRSGLFTKKLSFAFYDRIQTVSIKQSPFDRRWNMASLFIDTAAAGPADHAIDIAYLDFEFAQTQFDELQFATAMQIPV